VLTPLCGLGAQPPSFLKVLRGLLAETAVELGLDGSNLPFAVQRYVFVAENQHDATFAAEQALHHSRMVTNMRTESPDLDGAVLNAPIFTDEPSVQQCLENSLIGSVYEVVEKIVDEVTTYGITHISVFMQFANMPYAKTQRSLYLFCDEVIPKVKKHLAENSLQQSA
jgi:alkanesulfonate monooxygenase SsuD/methylene tetrahydromethanopterin reductase-like flavin-dependent oxidoreductase (luciferase family)